MKRHNKRKDNNSVFLEEHKYKLLQVFFIRLKMIGITKQLKDYLLFMI